MCVSVRLNRAPQMRMTGNSDAICALLGNYATFYWSNISIPRNLSVHRTTKKKWTARTTIPLACAQMFLVRRRKWGHYLMRFELEILGERNASCADIVSPRTRKWRKYQHVSSSLKSASHLTQVINVRLQRRCYCGSILCILFAC